MVCALLAAIAAPAAEAGDPAAQHPTLLRIIVVYPALGHSAVYLERDGRRLYWDPGGTYGMEFEDCLDNENDDFRSECARFAGFPWDRINATRRHDVLVDDMADLTRIMSIYFLDGDSEIRVYSLRLNGEAGARAWDLIENGARLGDAADFKTDRLTLTCTRAVMGYLRKLGDMFRDIGSSWYPAVLAEELDKITGLERTTYTLGHPRIQQYIKRARVDANLPPAPRCQGVQLALYGDPGALNLINGRRLCRSN